MEENVNVIEEGTPQYEFLEKAQNVEVRDGDDLINIELMNEEDESTEADVEQSETEVEPVGEEEGGLQELNSFDKVESISDKLTANRNGFEEMTSKAIEAGKMSSSDIEVMMNEYEKEGTLSEATLSKLAEAGYPESFVRSYIQGQEALAQQYTNEIFAVAGGEENFNRYTKHLESVSPTTLKALENAIVNCDLDSVKGIMELTRTSIASRYGKSQQRTVTQQVKQVHTPRVESFGSKADMVSAMSDPRYNRDPQYTREVNTKVINSNF